MTSAFPPSRPLGNFSSSTNAPQAQGPKGLPVDLPALQNASRVLQDQLVKDSQIIPDLGDTLTARMRFTVHSA
jgi:nuclear pore complex protein Nup155